MTPVVAVDAMGGDRAPGVVIDGVVDAVRRLDVAVLLVGPAGRLEEELVQRGVAGLPAITIIDAPDVIGMDEAPLVALRQKRRSSIRVAAELLASGQAQALFSAGHSGATFLAVHKAVGTLAGVDRPALAVTVPTRTGTTVLLDVGANVECRPEHLVEFGRLGSAYARVLMGMETPRVALLSIGEEAGKGTDLVRETYARLERTPLNFIGNLEARDLFTGQADVVVCDGYTGNVALKVGEGLVEAIEKMIREELARDPTSEAGHRLARGLMARFRQGVDAAEHGGALLVGAGGLVLIGHGRSSPRAVESGIAMAARLIQQGVLEQLQATLKRSDLSF